MGGNDFKIEIIGNNIIVSSLKVCLLTVDFH